VTALAVFIIASIGSPISAMCPTIYETGILTVNSYNYYNDFATLTDRHTAH